MSGIFDLFGGTNNARQGPTEAAQKMSMQSNMFSGGMAGKNAGLNRGKAKGLSMRSGNDLNIKNLSIKTSKSPAKKSPIKGLLKPDGGQSAGATLQLSPRSKAKSSKIQILKSKQLKALSSKTKSPQKDLSCEKKQAEEFLFKKPLMPVKNINKKSGIYSDREVLANYYDNRFDDHFDLENERLPFQKLYKDAVKSFDDEGFESDPDTSLQLSMIPVELRLYETFISFPEELAMIKREMGIPELPSLSDDEDDFWPDN